MWLPDANARSGGGGVAGVVAPSRTAAAARTTRWARRPCPTPCAEPVRACARQRAALPILWMGPGLKAGLGGSSRTARASGRAQVCLPVCLLMCVPNAHSVCCRPQAAISGRCLEPRRQPEWPWRSSACSYSWTMHVCVLCTGVARMCTDRVRTCVHVDVRHATIQESCAHNSGPLWTQTMILGVLEMSKFT